MRRRSGRLVLGLLLGVLLIVAAGCGGGEPSSGASGADKPGAPIKIAEIDPLTGPAASSGIPTANGVKLAVDEINKAGGVDIAGEHRPLELRQYDDQASPTAGRTAITRMLEQDDIHLATGFIASASLSGVQPYIARHTRDIALLAISTTKQLAEAANVYRYDISYDTLLSAEATYAAKQGWKRVAVLYSSDIPGIALAMPTVMSAYEKLGIDVVLKQATTIGQGDFSSVITKAKALNPASIAFFGFLDDQVQLIKQVREVGWDLPITSMNGIPASVVGKSISARALTNVINIELPTPQDLAETGNANAKDLLKNYQAMFGTEPGYLTLLGYESVYALKASLELAGSDDPTEVVKAFGQVKPWPEMLLTLAETPGGRLFNEEKGLTARLSVIRFVNGESKLEGYL